MSDKQKKFEPSTGWLVAVNAQIIAVARVSDALDMDPVVLGKALEKSGYHLQPDPFDFSADAWKVIEKSANRKEEPTDGLNNYTGSSRISTTQTKPGD